MSEPITEAEAFAVMQVMIDRIAELESEIARRPTSARNTSQNPANLSDTPL